MSTPDEPASAGAPARIILAEDDPAIRDAVSRYLRYHGLVVIACENGRQALQCLDRDGADMVITDLFMPDSDGIELMRHLRLRARNHKTIVISGGSRFSNSASAAARLLGASVVLRKPFDFAELLAAVRTTLSTRA